MSVVYLKKDGDKLAVDRERLEQDKAAARARDIRFDDRFETMEYGGVMMAIRKDATELEKRRARKRWEDLVAEVYGDEE